MSTLDQILKSKIVAIIRGADPADVLRIADALQLGGVNILEVTLNSPNALQVINALTGKMKNMLIGAGTVLSAADAQASIEAGAKFIISPNVTNYLFHKLTQQENYHYLSGLLIGTEIREIAGSDGVTTLVSDPHLHSKYDKAFNLVTNKTASLKMQNADKAIVAGQLEILKRLLR